MSKARTFRVSFFWLKNIMATTRRLLYTRWYDMTRRCNKADRNDYQRYGGSGIKVCSQWSDFEKFYKDMSWGFRKGLTLDRIDSELGYSPENCRWASSIEQANNKKSNRVIEYLGQKKTLAQWIRHFGLKSSTVRQRYYVYNFPLERVFA